MDEQQLNQVIRALKLEILTLLQNADLTNDNEAQRVLVTINNTFNRLDVEVDEILPPLVLQEYFSGLEIANNELYRYNAVTEQMHFNFEEGIESTAKIQMIEATLSNQLHYEAVAEVSENLMMDLKSAIRTARDNANISIVNALADVQRDLQSGIIRGSAKREINQRVMESFDRNGFTSFTTRDGRELPLDFYSEVVTRTNLRKAHTQGASNRYRERGVNLFKVSGGYPTCHECKSYRGIVFSMDEDNEDFPYLDPNRIPFHPNCQCTIQPFVIEYQSDDVIEQEKRKAKDFKPNEDVRTPAEKKAYERKQKWNRIENEEKKRYAEVKAVLGDDAPATLGAFRRMKRAGTSNYKALMMNFNERKNTIGSG